MCDSVAFETLSECLAAPCVKKGDVRVYKKGTPPPGIFVPPPGDSARKMHLELVEQHFEEEKAVG